MIQEKMIEDVVRNVLQNMTAAMNSTNNLTINSESAQKSAGLNPDKDYPLATKRPELVKTPTGKDLNYITLEKVLNGEINADDLRIIPETLRMQAEIAEGDGRAQFANNLRRAAELTAIPDDRILEIYTSLRPYRSTKQELLDIANELESKYNAKVNAAFIREAAEVYERRKRLRTE